MKFIKRKLRILKIIGKINLKCFYKVSHTTEMMLKKEQEL